MKALYVSDDGKKCERRKKCINIDIFDTSVDPFEVVEDSIIPVDYDVKISDIGKRTKTIKILTDDEKNDWEVLKDYTELKIIKNYNNLLLKELSNNKENYIDNNIYLVTSIQYNNFTITTYPLDIENFVYNQIFYFLRIPNIIYLDYFSLQMR